MKLVQSFVLATPIDPEPHQVTPARPATPARPLPLPESEPAHGVSLVVATIWQQARRNALSVTALVLGFVLALRVFRRPQ